MVEKRKFVRIPVNWITKVRAIYFSKKTKEETTIKALEKENIIRDISPGGVFIESNCPFPPGTVIEIEFTIPERGTIVAEGIVRWSNDGTIPDRPIGMGIEFLNVQTKGTETITVFIEDKLQERIREVVLKTDLHKNILRYYVPGKSYKLLALAQFLSISKDDIEKFKQILEDFRSLGIINISGDEIRFTQPTDPRVRRYLTIAISEIKK